MKTKKLCANTNNKGMGIYIHIPFCASKCGYCDFLSFEGAGVEAQEKYVQALVAELRGARKESTRQNSRNLHVVGAGSSRPLGIDPAHHGHNPQTPRFSTDISSGREDPAPTKPQIDTVYLGGGTPTALHPHLLSKILQEIRHFNLSPDVEITVEMNPITNAGNLLETLTTQGVNRLSIGLQAWQPHLLKTIKRAHWAQDFEETILAARAAGINNINVDLMFGLPGQTLADWHETIANVLAHKPHHISAYSLTPAENTPIWDALETGNLTLPPEESDREMYHEAIRLFTEAGYTHYELSNFAKPGRESRHNVDCWTRKPYIGFGLGAHSFDGAARWHNTEDMGRYLAGASCCLNKKPLAQHKTTSLAASGLGDSPKNHIREDYEKLSTQDAMAETLILGLRMTAGISATEFYNQFGVHLANCFGTQIEKLVTQGLLLHSSDRIALTPKGLDLANQVFEVFL